MSDSLLPYLPDSLTSVLMSTSFFSKSPEPHHPILPFLVGSQQAWSQILKSQSQSPYQARRAYKRRYKPLIPPPGFDKWYAFAQSQNHQLVDEYDSMMDDLLPFRDLSPAEIRRRTAELARIPGISLLTIRNGEVRVHSKSGRWAPAAAMEDMIRPFAKELPDLEIAINEKQEGRVLPKKEREFNDKSHPIYKHIEHNSSLPSLAGFTADWQGYGSVWDSFRRACPPTSPARRILESVRSVETVPSSKSPSFVLQKNGGDDIHFTRRKLSSATAAIPPTRELTFSRDADTTLDLCTRPSLHTLHSTFFSDQRSIDELYPLFSPSKPAGFGDILIPSNHHWSPSTDVTYDAEVKQGRTKESSDPEWGLKSNTIFWRGKVTRGANTPPGHMASFQKQRLVKMSNDNREDDRVVVALNLSTSALISTTSTVAEVNEAIMDVALACDPSLGECAQLSKMGYRVEAPGPINAAWNHKFVLDVDEIGFSPRFFAFMESRSAVVKSSMQKEFWNSWIMPWYHYIPLSSAYSELHNIHAFFFGFPASILDNNNHTISVLTPPDPVIITRPDGTPFHPELAAQDIAEAGRDWVQNHVRRIDMQIYVYRLMLEWARLVSDDR
ncbi:glycosyltransferase family 90 protein [Atractiella rhizophila]|nr:glycosyltransferase family 90 protein [Atractiella rhizophila]